MAILCLLILISLIRFQIIIEYNEALQMYVRVMHIFRIPITPRKEKPIKLSAYSPAAVSKREKKQREKEARKAQKKAEKKELKQKKKQEKRQKKKSHASDKGSGRTLSENISLIIDVVKALLGSFFGHLRIDLSRIHISIAGEDAAQTAILYGVVCQSVAYLLEIMKKIKTVHPPDPADVSVTPDWIGEKSQIDIKLSFSLRVWHVFALIGRVIGRLISHLLRDAKNKKRTRTARRTSPPKPTPVVSKPSAQHGQ